MMKQSAMDSRKPNHAWSCILTRRPSPNYGKNTGGMEKMREDWFGSGRERGCDKEGANRRAGGEYEGKNSPIVTNIEFFRGIQEEISLRAVGEASSNLLYASLQDFGVEHRAVCPGEASLVWRSVERALAALTRMSSILDRLVTTMGVISSMLRHRGTPERRGSRRGHNSRRRAVFNLTELSARRG